VSLPVAILAGGLGTRLGAKAGDLPKALVDVGGKPFLVHQLELLRRNGLDHVVVCAGYRGEAIQDRLAHQRALQMRIEVVLDGPTLLGTGGALKRALPLLGDAFFVLYGDSYLDIDYQAVRRAFEQSRPRGLMTVYRNAGRWDRSNVVFANGRILRYDKRRPTPDMSYIDYGLGILRREALDGVREGEPSDLAEVYEDLVARGELAGLEVHQRFYEIGSPEGLEETRRHLSPRG
jgi:NDP-sugar pyrophosphorylase family protein